MAQNDTYRAKLFTEQQWKTVDSKETQREIGYLIPFKGRIFAKRRSSAAQTLLKELESNILIDIDHSNVVQFIGTLSESSTILLKYVCFDLNPDFSIRRTVNNLRQYLGTLDNYDKIYQGQTKFNSLTRIFTDITEGLAYLHSREIVHVDLIPSNILMSSSESDGTIRAQIAGFANAYDFKDNASIPLEHLRNSGDILFKAPEVVLGQLSSRVNFVDAAKTDVWALGCIAFCLMNSNLHHPYQQNIDINNMSSSAICKKLEYCLKKQMQFVGSSKYEWLALIASDLSNTMDKCLQFDPNNRANSQALNKLSLKTGTHDEGDLVDFMTNRLTLKDPVTELHLNDITDNGEERKDEGLLFKTILKILKKLLMIYPEYWNSGSMSLGLFEKLKNYNVDGPVYRHADRDVDVRNAGVHDMFVAALTLCAPSLRKILYSKAFMCKLAVPFVVKDHKHLTLYTNALKGIRLPIVRSGYHSEVNCYYHKIKAISFLGLSYKAYISKSETINYILGGGHNTKSNVFFERSWLGGHKKRNWAHGVIEAAWYLPTGTRYDTFNTELMFLNLRGKASNNLQQRELLCQMSSVVVVFITLTDFLISTEIRLVHDQMKTDNLLNPPNDTSKASKHLLIVLISKEAQSAPRIVMDRCKALFPGNFPDNIHIVEATNSEHRDSLVEVHLSVQRAISHIVKHTESMFEISGESLEILKQCDTSCVKDNTQSECAAADKSFEAFIPVLPIHGGNSKLDLRLQESWKEWTELERAARKEAVRSNEHAHKALDLLDRIRMQQLRQCTEPYLCTLFMQTCCEFYKQKQYIAIDRFVDNVSCYLQKWALRRYASLNETYLEESMTADNPHDTYLEMEENGEELFFGIQRLFRDVAQIYEAIATCKKIRANKVTTLPDHLVQFKDFPNIFGMLIKFGFTFEIMDGDAAGVPLIWLKSVIESLNTILPTAKILILGVLGIQSSGKSTLLNAMFGLDFPVSAGGCTRGIFARLVKIENKHGIDYVLVLDTEGIRGSEVEDGVKMDNEIVTFLVGVADMIIINVKGELYLEISHVLQIAIHAFTLMHLAYRTKRCMFVHQNVSAPDAGAKLAPRRKKLIKTLNDAVIDSARRLGQTHLSSFKQIMDIDEERDIFYLGDLWAGEPPMAGTNPYYHFSIKEVKRCVFKKVSDTDAMNWNNLYEQILAVWQGIMSNQCVFNFKNIPELERSVRQRAIERKIDVDTYIYQYCANEARIAFTKCNTRDELHAAEAKLLVKQQKHLGEIMRFSTSNLTQNDEIIRIAVEKQKEKVLNMKSLRWKQLTNEAVKYFDQGCGANGQVLSLLKKGAQLLLLAQMPPSDVLKITFSKIWDSRIKPLLHGPSGIQFRNEVQYIMEETFPLKKHQIRAQIKNFGQQTVWPAYKDVIKGTELSNLGTWVQNIKDRRGWRKNTDPEDVLESVFKSSESFLKKSLKTPQPFSKVIFS